MTPGPLPAPSPTPLRSYGPTTTKTTSHERLSRRRVRWARSFRRNPLPGPWTTSIAVAEHGFLVMVAAAEAGQVVEAGHSAGGNGLTVVDLRAAPLVAARNDALRIAALEKRAETGRDGAAGVGHGDNVVGLGHQHLQIRVVGQLARDADRDGADTGDLALLPFDGVTPDHRVVVDPHVDRSLRAGRLIAVAAASGQVDEGVDPVRFLRLEPTAGLGLVDPGVADAVDAGQQPGAVVRCESR